MLSRHIFLIGMPGTGKSSLGRKVSANLHLPYIDTDRRIMEILGTSTMGELFERYGEDAFRRAERNMLIRLASEKPCMVSTGGGMVIQPENRELMQNFGVILLVDRPLEQILSDIKLDRRPTLAAGGLSEVERVYWERIGKYREAADLVLDNSQGYYAGVANLERLLKRRFAL